MYVSSSYHRGTAQTRNTSVTAESATEEHGSRPHIVEERVIGTGASKRKALRKPYILRLVGILMQKIEESCFPQHRELRQ